jgi:antitoxin component YwqK of YwqJK toxin-antitoxin module
MRFLDRIKLRWLTRKHSSTWTDSDKRKITELINKSNKEIEVVRWETFPGTGKPYRHYHSNGAIRAEGFYYALGYDKKGRVKDEKFQGKNVDYHENGQVKDEFFYKDGIPTGEYYSYDIEGKLIFNQPPEA